MQRFGTHSIPTYVVGISILKGEWREAVEVIMQAKAEDNDRIAEARQVWSEKQDAKKALSLFPFRCIAERSIVQFFSKRGKTDDYMGALLAIPRNLRMLYVHSYQSLIFNAMATERLKMFGHKLVIGDLVEISADDAPIVPEEKHDTIKEDSGVHNDPSTADKEGEKENEPEEDTRSKMKVKVIQTEEDLARYTIYDMVLPLPGYDVMYPKHALFDEYKSLMKTHGFDPLDMKRKQKQFSLTGSYRKVVGQAKDLTWRKVRYDDSTVSLCRTDLEKSLGMPEVESIPGTLIYLHLYYYV